MDKKLKQKWLDLLRSGKYKQVTGVLRGVRRDKTIGYCCLGVISQVYCNSKKCSIVDMSNDHSVLSNEVVDWLGVSNNDPEILVEKMPAKLQKKIEKFAKSASKSVPEKVSLSDLNDTYRFTFKQIADCIEEGL